MTSKDETNHYPSFGSSPIVNLDYLGITLTISNQLLYSSKTKRVYLMESHVSCQHPDLDSELIQLCIRVLEKSDYLGIGLTVSNQIAYSTKI